MACYKDFSELLNVFNHRLTKCLFNRLAKGVVRVQD